MKIDILTTNQVKKIIKETIKSQFLDMWKRIDELRLKVIKLEEEHKCKLNPYMPKGTCDICEKEFNEYDLDLCSVDNKAGYKSMWLCRDCEDKMEEEDGDNKR